jgi:hypothetical protein
MPIAGSHPLGDERNDSGNNRRSQHGSDGDKYRSKCRVAITTETK